MCGIAGTFSAKELKITEKQNLAEMLKTLHHRGPDGKGEHFDLKNGLAMGHTRLTIIDLQTGKQPLLHKRDNHDLALTVNGEFYDYKRIRTLFYAEGEKFTTKSDSEIIFPLYKKYGLKMMQHLRGEFSFALYDAKKQRLILCRDRFGIRPLFFHFNDNKDTIYYASEPKALLEHPKIEQKTSPKLALHQLMQVTVPGTSAFEGIHALEPGHMMIIEKKQGRLETQTHQYWDFEFPEKNQTRLYEKPQDAVRIVREKLTEAIIHRLEADVPVGCYLSGGIDSCCILGLAAGAMQSPVKAFTISFDNDDYDESKIAKEMAKSAGAEQEVINLTANDLYGENFIKTAKFAERTFYNTLGVAKYLMSKRVNECGYRCVITGEGSDELFGGYPAFKRDMFLHGLQDEDEETRKIFQQRLEKNNALFKGAILSQSQHTHPAWEELCGFTPSWLQPWIETLDEVKNLMSDEAKEELNNYDPLTAIAEKINPKMLKKRHPLDIAQYTWSKCQLEGQILNWGGDRVDMANSMESRPAFLDHHLAETATQVPPHWRINLQTGGTEKWVLREAVRGVLPEVLYKREKFAFMAPPAHTDISKRKEVEKLIATYLNTEKLQNSKLLDQQNIEKLLTNWHEGTNSASQNRLDIILNHLLCLEILDINYSTLNNTLY